MYYSEDLFETNMALRCENRALHRVISEFKSGKRYAKIQEDHHKVVCGYVKEIEKLRKELGAARMQNRKDRDTWISQNIELWEESQKKEQALNERLMNLEDRYWELQRKYDEDVAAVKSEYAEKLDEKELVIEELKGRLAHALALLDRDSTNTSTPTSQTPAGKAKHIPNSRRGTGRPKGGQVGHAKHTLEKPGPDEVTDEAVHVLRDGDTCRGCGSSRLEFTGEYDEDYEYEIEVLTRKTHHRYAVYRCADCGTLARVVPEANRHSQCRYGATVQAVALSLMATTNAAINKVAAHLWGLTDAGLAPCEGYIAKLVPRAAKNLGGFMEDLLRHLVSRRIVYWDDTVAMADRKRICLRFYGDESVAYYVAHEKKDMAGVVEDGVLGTLAEDSVVMHDHNSINYNERFRFQNVECNAHLQRDLQKIVDETGHAEFGELKELVSGAIMDRNDIVRNGGTGFGEEYVEAFEERLTSVLEKAKAAAESNRSKYSAPFERQVVSRIEKYKGNYFAWVRDFTIPTTNNLSERALRGVKPR